LGCPQALVKGFSRAAQTRQPAHLTRIETPQPMGEFFVIREYDERNQLCKEFIMRNKFDGFIMGLILIAAGGLFMARNLGYDIDLTPTFGMVVFGTLSALCFIRYFAGDLKLWDN
jgi:hypothetical protein